MNQHLECVARLDDVRAGRLDPEQAEAWQAHARACPLCRGWVEAWPAAALVPDLVPAVRRGLEGKRGAALPLASREASVPARAAAAWRVPAWVPALGLAACCALALAFWHPERAWLRCGQAWWAACPGGGVEAACCPR